METAILPVSIRKEGTNSEFRKKKKIRYLSRHHDIKGLTHPLALGEPHLTSKPVSPKGVRSWPLLASKSSYFSPSNTPLHCQPTLWMLQISDNSLTTINKWGYSIKSEVFGDSKYSIEFGMCSNICFDKETFHWFWGPHLTLCCPRAYWAWGRIRPWFQAAFVTLQWVEAIWHHWKASGHGQRLKSQGWFSLCLLVTG